MYITYETTQYSLIDGEWSTYAKRVKPHRIIPNDLPKPDFMPAKLVRISDMKVVDGSQVNEGYCALSYSWNQSGDIVIDETTGKYKRIDEGKHKITSYDDIFPDMVIPHYKMPIEYAIRSIEKWSKLSKIYHVFKIMEDKHYYFSNTIQYVKFEGIIQQICQQFNIKYIWYDQLCINQNNKEDKYREIRNMHYIYENAHCTVALVPDYSNSNSFLHPLIQQYFKRLWTLEEAVKSKRLLFVGRDRHKWGDDTIFGIDTLTKPSSKLSVSQILYHAHQRSSTNEHDRVFALIQLFPEFIDKIKIDYDQKFEDLMIQFYVLLAKKDIRILFFGKNRSYESTIEKYKFLPSWTGVNGEHYTLDVTTTSFQNYDIIGKTMHVTTAYVPSIDDDSLTIQEEDLPLITDRINDGDNEDDYYLCIFVQLSNAKEMERIVLLYDDCDKTIFKRPFFDTVSERLQQLSRFMEIKRESLCWCNIESNDYRTATTIEFGDLTDNLNDPSAQYAILSEISFQSGNHLYRYYPVIKKEQGKEYYIAIGCCDIGRNKDFFSDCNLPKQTFLIQ